LLREKQLLPESLVYDTSKKLTLDYYGSKIVGNRPSIIVVHGGSWSGGDSKQLPELNTHLSERGYNVCSINYRLAPQFQSPAPEEDIHQCIKFLTENHERYHIDTSCFILLGRSAGAQLVLAAAYKGGQSNIKGVISFYGPADMIWGYKNPAPKRVMDSKKVMEDFLGGTYDQAKEQYKNSSPIEIVKNSNPVPTLLIHGKNDPLVAYEHSIRLERKLVQYKVPYFFLTLPWATHGCDYTLNGPSGQLSVYTIDHFLSFIAQK
jgi:acetyl esterase/lipase